MLSASLTAHQCECSGASAEYVGDVQNGKRHGHGVYYYDSGDKYTGGFVKGRMDGQVRRPAPRTLV